MWKKNRRKKRLKLMVSLAKRKSEGGSQPKKMYRGSNQTGALEKKKKRKRGDETKEVGNVAPS